MTSYAPGSYLPGYGIVGQSRTAPIPYGGGWGVPYMPPWQQTGFQVTAGKDPSEIVPGTGLPRWLHEKLGRNLGFEGQYTQGEHNRFLSGDPSRAAAYQRAVAEAKDDDPNTNFGQDMWLHERQPSGLTRAQQFAIAKRQGYAGGRGAGEHNAWLTADPTRKQQFERDIGLVSSVMSAFGNPWDRGLGAAGRARWQIGGGRAGPAVDYGAEQVGMLGSRTAPVPYRGYGRGSAGGPGGGLGSTGRTGARWLTGMV